MRKYFEDSLWRGRGFCSRAISSCGGVNKKTNDLERMLYAVYAMINGAGHCSGAFPYL